MQLVQEELPPEMILAGYTGMTGQVIAVAAKADNATKASPIHIRGQIHSEPWLPWQDIACRWNRGYRLHCEDVQSWLSTMH